MTIHGFGNRSGGDWVLYGMHKPLALKGIKVLNPIAHGTVEKLLKWPFLRDWVVGIEREALCLK